MEGRITGTRRLAFDPAWSEWDAFEISEYISSFKASSDRARFVFYIVLAVSLLIATASWNLESESWAQLRLHKIARQQLGLSQAPLNSPRASSDEEAQVENKVRTYYFDHYPETFVQEVVLVDIPLLGISVDVNDFGLLGGVMLALLMTLLLMSIIRMDENLYLSIFKIRRLHEQEGRTDGESRANLLYHALAMGQVLFHPPTLARWKVRRRHGFPPKALRGVLFIPFAAHAWTVYRNAMTVYIAIWYREGNVPALRLVLQFALLAIIGALVVACCWYVRATEQRWRNVFFFINPRHRLLAPKTLWRWLRLGSGWSRDEKTLREQWKPLLGALTNDPNAITGKATEHTMALHHVVPWTRETRSGPFAWRRRNRYLSTASLDLMRAARREAQLRCRDQHLYDPELSGFQILERRETEKSLEIDVLWHVQAKPIPIAGTKPSKLADSSLQSAAHFRRQQESANRGYY